MSDLMHMALNAMERGDYETGIRLARASNDRLNALVEWKHRNLPCTGLIAEPSPQSPSSDTSSSTHS